MSGSRFAAQLLARYPFYSSLRAWPSMACARNLSQESFHVEHDRVNREFFIKFGKEKAVLQYEVIDPKTLDLVHTEVPESLRGKGIAKHLAKGALEYVAGKGLQAQITCPYVSKFTQTDAAKKEYQSYILKWCLLSTVAPLKFRKCYFEDILTSQRAPFGQLHVCCKCHLQKSNRAGICDLPFCCFLNHPQVGAYFVLHCASEAA